LLVKGTMVGGADGLFRWATPNETSKQSGSELLSGESHKD